MTDLTIQDETFHIEIEGDPTKPSVILSNSLGTDLHLWDEQMPALLQHFRVVRYDPRGHGRSDVGSRPYSIARLGRDVLAILDALEIESAHFIGISMGGAVGQWLLAHAPARLGRVVLANTAARFGTSEGWNARILSVRRDGMAANADATIARWFSDAFREAAGERASAVHATLANASVEGYASACAALRDLDLRHAGMDPAKEVLVVTGVDDPVISAEDTAVLLSGLAGARHVELDAMHLSNIEAAPAFNDAVVRFLTAPQRAATRKPAPSTSRRASPRTEKSTRKLVARSPARALPATTRTRTAGTAAPRAARAAVRGKAAPLREATKTTGKTAKSGTAGTKTTAARGAKITAPGKARGATAAPAKSAATKPAATKPEAVKPAASRTTKAQKAAKVQPAGKAKTSVTRATGKMAARSAATGRKKAVQARTATAASVATRTPAKASRAGKAVRTPPRGAAKTVRADMPARKGAAKAAPAKMPAARGAKAAIAKAAAPKVAAAKAPMARLAKAPAKSPSSGKAKSAKGAAKSAPAGKTRSAAAPFRRSAPSRKR